MEKDRISELELPETLKEDIYNLYDTTERRKSGREYSPVPGTSTD